MSIIAFAEGAAGTAGEAAANPTMSLIQSILPLVLLVGVFYFMLIRPQRKKDKENREMLANLKVGDQIITIGGIVGKVSRIKDEKIFLETGTKTEPVVVQMERWAVKEVIKPISAD